MLLCLPAYGVEVPEKPYVWTCKAESYFGMEATADGKAHPVVEALQPTANPIRITIRRRSKEATELAKGIRPSSPDPLTMPEYLFDLDPRFVVVFEQGALSPHSAFFQTRSDGNLDYTHSGVKLTFAHNSSSSERKLESVDAFFTTEEGLKDVLTIQPGEKDWVFFVYAGSLMTDIEARSLNMHFPSAQAVANAHVYFLTGPCIQDW
jgi:hypothetical protein